MMMMTRMVLTIVLVAAGFDAAADDKSKAEQDQRIARVALDAANAGSDLYNAGNHEGCFRFYQGTLMAVLPTLDYRPELAGRVKARLDEAKASRSPASGAFVLRAAIDEVLKETASAKKPLWDRLGGEAGVRAVVREFLVTASQDKKANIDRNGNYPLTKERVERVEQLVVEMVSSVTGGPLKYTGRDMKNSHAGMKITEEEFKIAAGHLIAALKKYNVPQAEIDELVGIVATTAKDIVEKK